MALADLGFSTRRRDTPKGSTSLVGVWTPGGRKLASIGMRIRGGVTSHGFALNIDPDTCRSSTRSRPGSVNSRQSRRQP